MNPLLIALTVTACLSPLLTFTCLFQLKEWRMDRLREHLRSEGVFRSLFGIIRPIIIATALLMFFVFHFEFFILTTLSLLTTLNIIQIILKKQKYPTWTQKSLILFGTAILINLIMSLFVDYKLSANLSVLMIFPLLQPFFLLLTWLLWLPVDHMLKRHTFEEARALRAKFPDLTVIAITGSVGKTTTKELLAHMLADFYPLVTPQYLNTEMGVAQWLIKNLRCKTQNTKLLIVEMGAYKKGEIKTLCSIVQPTIGIITAIGTQHLALFGSEKAVAEAKGELLEALPKNGHAFINAITPFVKELTKKTKCPLTLVQSHIPYSSISLAKAVATHLGVNHDHIQKKIHSFTPPPHTFSIRVKSNVTILDDTHNVSPESVLAAIEWAKMQPPEYKILITPGIIELGTQECAIHEQLAKAATSVFNRVIFLNKRYAKMFQRGYEKSVEVYSKNTPPVPQGSLLVCIGRMSDTIIQNLLP